MDWLTQLWLPILLSGVAAFFASFLVWMVIGHHKSDWKGVENEEAARDALRGTPPGQYVVPFVGTDWKSEEAKAKYREGPVGFLTFVPPGAPRMGGKLIACLVLNVLVSLLSAYVASHLLPTGATFAQVFRVVGTVAVSTYALGHIQGALWFGKPRGVIAKDVLDGVAYGLVTAAVFAALWP